MRTLLATVLIVLSLIAGVSLWNAAHTRNIDVSSSQIYIHGTPVCVMRHGGEILASVGTCDSHGGRPWEGGFGTGGGSLLPPGHPPVDSSPEFEQLRKLPI